MRIQRGFVKLLSSHRKTPSSSSSPVCFFPDHRGFVHLHLHSAPPESTSQPPPATPSSSKLLQIAVSSTLFLRSVSLSLCSVNLSLPRQASRRSLLLRSNPEAPPSSSSSVLLLPPVSSNRESSPPLFSPFSSLLQKLRELLRLLLLQDQTRDSPLCSHLRRELQPTSPRSSSSATGSRLNSSPEFTSVTNPNHATRLRPSDPDLTRQLTRPSSFRPSFQNQFRPILQDLTRIKPEN